ncbi:MAG TPA: PIN domain nuclease [Marmoricola sp.]|nr:PIN domain nuclease [Marmoricola sp.]
MTLVDTSVWVEFLRATPSGATAFIRDRLGADELGTTEPVLMELLAGARPGEHTTRLERLLLSQSWYQVQPALDYRGAVDVYQATRASGHQPRSVQDCLIAAVALRHQVAVAHRDADYEHIAAATRLRVVDLRE